MDLPVYTCRKTLEPVRIDGLLDEAAWERAEPVVLSQWDGSPASQETIARLCWDDRNLYIGFQCADTDIYSTYTKRDEPVWEQEAVEAFINPSSDLVNYYELEVSPRNVIFDLRVTNPHHSRTGLIVEPGWDCPGMQTAVHVDGTINDHSVTDKGWTCEMAIPFASLKGAPNTPPLDGDTWRINLFRIDMFPSQEFDCWSPTLGDKADFHKPQRFGTLVFRR